MFPLVNGTLGGGGVSGWHHTEATKKNLSATLAGRPRPEAAQWISEALKGRPKSPEHAAKCRVAAPRKAILDQNGVTYASVREAARKLNLNKGSIWKVLRGRLKSTGGYSFSEIK